MTIQGKRRQRLGATGGLLIFLVSAVFGWFGEASGAEVQHRFAVLSSRLRVQLHTRATVTQCRRDGRGFVISVAGLSPEQLQRAFRNWRPDPLLAAVRVLGDSSGAEATLVLSLGSSVPEGNVRAAVRRQVLEIVAQLTRPATSDYYTEAGIYLARRGRRREALAQFRKAIALQPDNARAYLEAARVRAALGERSLAIFNAKKAAKDARTRREALSLLARLDPVHWGRKARQSSRRQPALAATGRRPRAGDEPVQSAKNSAQPVAASATAEARPAPAKKASEKSEVADKSSKEDAAKHGAVSSEPSTAVLAETQTKEDLKSVDPFSTPVNAWAFLFALTAAALFTAPLTWVLVRANKKDSRSTKSPFVRVPANTPPLGDFQRLLVERTGGLGPAPDSAPSESEEPVEETPSVPTPQVLEHRETPEEETPIAVNNPFARPVADRPFRDVRVELESVIALADRGLSPDEIARRIGMGREEVRLVLAMSRTRSRREVWAPAGEPGLSLTFAE